MGRKNVEAAGKIKAAFEGSSGQQGAKAQAADTIDVEAECNEPIAESTEPPKDSSGYSARRFPTHDPPLLQKRPDARGRLPGADHGVHQRELHVLPGRVPRIDIAAGRIGFEGHQDLLEQADAITGPVKPGAAGKSGQHFLCGINEKHP